MGDPMVKQCKALPKMDHLGPSTASALLFRLNGSSEFRGCKAGAGGALFARSDVLLTRRRGCLGFDRGDPKTGHRVQDI